MKNATIALIIILSCYGSTMAQSASWENTEINCSSYKHERAIKQFPYAKSKESSSQGDTIGLKAFNIRMRLNFAESGMDSTEALVVLQIILDENFVRDESYGMPSPDSKPPPKQTVSSLSKRIALKKISENTYEILYFNYGCGRKFHHSTMEIGNGKIVKKERKESWSASFPC